MKEKIPLDRRRIEELIKNIDRQVERLSSLAIPNENFFTKKENWLVINSIKYGLACAIEDVSRIAIHLSVALGLERIKEDPSEAIVALGSAGIIPVEFADKIKKMPGFRNRIIHDYLPNKFDASELYKAMKNLDDFRNFSQYILTWLETK